MWALDNVTEVICTQRTSRRQNLDLNLTWPTFRHLICTYEREKGVDYVLAGWTCILVCNVYSPGGVELIYSMINTICHLGFFFFFVFYAEQRKARGWTLLAGGQSESVIHFPSNFPFSGVSVISGSLSSSSAGPARNRGPHPQVTSDFTLRAALDLSAAGYTGGLHSHINRVFVKVLISRDGGHQGHPSPLSTLGSAQRFFTLRTLAGRPYLSQ